MDPKANLNEQLTLARRFVRQSAEQPDEMVAFDEQEVVRLAELVIALDEWQRKGGFSPYEKKA
jgi:hypothetical protein